MLKKLKKAKEEKAELKQIETDKMTAEQMLDLPREEHESSEEPKEAQILIPELMMLDELRLIKQIFTHYGEQISEELKAVREVLQEIKNE